MKTLNKSATLTLYKLMNLMSEDHYAKIDNSEGAFMPVVVEGIFENEKYKQISLAHYYEQSGDMMADPEMLFIYDKVRGTFIPSYFKQDSLGIEQESVIIENGEIMAVIIKLQSDHTAFANKWLKNITEQQNL